MGKPRCCRRYNECGTQIANLKLVLCFSYKALSCFCLSGYYLETWPKASYSYKAMVIHCPSYIYWLGCANILFLHVCLGLFQGTNRHYFHIGSHGFGLSGDAKQAGSFVNIILPSPCIFHLSGFLCCLRSQMSYLGIKHMIMEKAQWLCFWYSSCLENTFHALEKTWGCWRHSRDQNLSSTERTSRWLEVNTARCRAGSCTYLMSSLW